MILIMNLQFHNTGYTSHNFSFVYLNLSYKQSLMKFLDLSFLKSSASLNKTHTEPWSWQWILSFITPITSHIISLSFVYLNLSYNQSLIQFLDLSSLKSSAIGTLPYTLLRFRTRLSRSERTRFGNWSHYHAWVCVFTMRW